MKTFAIALFSALALTTALAGCDEPPPPHPVYRPAVWDIGNRINWIQQRINHGRNDGSLDYDEFRRVQGELNRIKGEFNQDRAYNNGGLDGPTRADLERRLNYLNDQIHWLRENNEHRPW